MQVEQLTWNFESGWSDPHPGLRGAAQWVLVFGAPEALGNTHALARLASTYPGACIVGCSTAGEIMDTRVQDDTLVATAVHFADTQVRMATARVDGMQDSYQAGTTLGRALNLEGLVHVMVLSDGLTVNGTALARGLRDNLPPTVAVTGGLAGDGDRFKQTKVYAGGEVMENAIVAIGFYGDRLRVGYGSLGGWDTFGPERLVTRSDGNVLYELDGEPALALYKRYLGKDYAAQLPSSALSFPLSLRGDHIHDSVVRTILSVDEVSGSITFAGDVPQGSHATLMKANFDRLIDGAAGAARSGLQRLDSFEPALAVLISCVGRKLVLKQRVEEELEGVRQVMGPQALLAGFYSYGEICPHGGVTKCELHNQTMTITTFAES
ncbi:FIST signal transduction protein [Aquabacterium sp.]|uniref:FIST signal transduction protein n=1 Tax=Aquabacterium sp. TaxID=1872578 RepID=UPI00403821B1